MKLDAKALEGIGGNTGHGHVWARPDGMKARCGGPGICRECSRDLARFEKRLLAQEASPPAGETSDLTDKAVAWDAIAEKNAEIAKLRAALTALERERDEQKSFAKHWHREIEAIATIIGLDVPDAGEVPEAVRSLQDRFSEEVRIVNRIWSMFGSPSYDELAGRSIFDLVADVQARLTASEAARETAERQLAEALAAQGKPFCWVKVVPDFMGDMHNAPEQGYTDFSDEPKPGYEPLYKAPAASPPPPAVEPVAWFHTPTGKVVDTADKNQLCERFSEALERDVSLEFVPLYPGPAREDEGQGL